MATSAAEIPWYRRSDVNSAFVVIGLLVPPLLWFVCFNLITGDVYYTRRGGAGRLETWSTPNRAVAYGVVIAQLGVIVYLYGALFFSAARNKPAAEALVARYFDAMKHPATENPPRELYGSGFWSAMSDADLEKLNATIHRQLGALRSYELVGFKTSSSGKVRLIYTVQYEKGRVKETFWLGELKAGEGMRIQGHEIDAMR